MTAFSLPWYAIVGAQAALDVHLGYVAAVVIGVIATTAGRWIIDGACLVVPKQLVRGEFFVLAAALSAATYAVCAQALGIAGDHLDGDCFCCRLRFSSRVAGAGLGGVGAVGAGGNARWREATSPARRRPQSRTRRQRVMLLAIVLR